ncbi:MAG: C40 family peptidase [Lachnospiraceae bacterium]|nr:C40 family peptidase [Lachnospiraceae bacterium]
MNKRFGLGILLLVIWLLMAGSVTGLADTSDPSEWDSLCIGAVEGYVNIRKEPSEEGEKIGKLYQNSVGRILKEENENWVKIRSGLVTGYVYTGGILTDEQAKEQLPAAGYRSAQVLPAETNVYDEPNQDANVLTVVPESTFLQVLEKSEGWTKVVTPYQITGWVLADEIKVTISYSTAETLQQEEQRLSQQELANETAQKEKELWDIAEAALQGTAPTKVAVMEAQMAQEEAKNTFLASGGTQEEAEAIEERVLQSSEDEQSVNSDKEEETAAENPVEAEMSEESGPAVTDMPAESEQASAYRAAVEKVKDAMAAADADQAAAQEKVDAAQDASIVAQAAEKVAIEAARRAPRGAQGCNFTTLRDHTMYFPPSKGEELVNYASQFVGNPYVWGGESLTNGCDCSGFTMLVYARFGISLPHFAQSQAAYGYAVSESELEPGDLVFFQRGNYIYHVAIYIGNNTIIHSTNARSGICFTSIQFGGDQRLYRRLLD